MGEVLERNSFRARVRCFPSGTIERLDFRCQPLQRDSFPDDHVWDEFRKLLNEVTKRGARFPEDEKIRATTSQMSDEKAKESLQAAFAIYTHLAKAFGRTEFVI